MLEIEPYEEGSLLIRGSPDEIELLVKILDYYRRDVVYMAKSIMEKDQLPTARSREELLDLLAKLGMPKELVTVNLSDVPQDILVQMSVLYQSAMRDREILGDDKTFNFIRTIIAFCNAIEGRRSKMITGGVSGLFAIRERIGLRKEYESEEEEGWL